MKNRDLHVPCVVSILQFKRSGWEDEREEESLGTEKPAHLTVFR